MKKAINIIVFCWVVMMSQCTCSMAAEEKVNFAPGNKAAIPVQAKKISGSQVYAETKAGRGIKNLLLGWIEIPQAIIQETSDSKNPFWGLTAGTLKGAGKALPRTVSGVTDIITFPVDDYDKSAVNRDEFKMQVK